jgi:hypothetical protein
MKKYLFFLILLCSIFTSCEIPIRQVENPENSTTVEIQNLQKDTAIIAIDDNILYIYDRRNLVKYKVINYNDANYDYECVPSVVLAVLITLTILGIIFGFVLLSKD